MSDFHTSPTVIAEAGVNHNGEVALALALVDAAKDAGADMVKFQAFSAESLTSAAAPAAKYQSDRTGHADQRAMLSALELTHADFTRIADHCAARGIAFLCTPFDLDQLDFLLTLGMPAIKIASGELTNGPALSLFGRQGRPIYLSTGMATMAEVETAIGALRSAGATDITALHCTSLYPAPPDRLNLKAITTMREVLGIPVGYSDHSTNIHASIAAAALGATVIEKHLTLDKAMQGPDHAASLEPSELTAMIAGIREVAASLGDGIKRPAPEEAETAHIARRSWHARSDLAAGQTLQAGDIEPMRPACGIPANRDILGRAVVRPIPAGTPILEADLT